MSQQQSSPSGGGGTNALFIAAGGVLLIGLAALLLARGSDAPPADTADSAAVEDAAAQPAQPAQPGQLPSADAGEPGDQPGDDGDASATRPTGSGPDGELTPEERREAMVEATRQLYGGEPPSCEIDCDCPSGEMCQPGSMLCIPAPFPIWCCERDAGTCPDGTTCQMDDGSWSTCGAQE